ncbi:MAG: S9 family peptidase, partial [Proteobacteria bacterium]|nr:S9 family peptidase [Pseudomonadota bacterium]
MLNILRLSLCALACAAATAALAAEPAPGHRLNHADLWLLKRVGAPVLSPDGERAVFNLSEPAYAAKDAGSDLWLVATDGHSAARQLTHTHSPESGVAFSPDGSRIAFSARRDGDTEEQIYVLDLAGGGEALRVSSAALGARSPRFSPDGQSIAFEAEVWPGARDDADNRRLAKERADRPYAARVYDSFPVRRWDHWLDERQVHLFVQPLNSTAQALDLLAGSALTAHSGYSGRSEDDGVTLDATWTPDGLG